MVDQTPAMSYKSLRTRVEELELDRDRRAVSDAHSRFYAALAVASLYRRHHRCARGADPPTGLTGRAAVWSRQAGAG